MSTSKAIGTSLFTRSPFKKTSIGHGSNKLSSMNKSRKRGYKKYRGQGKAG